MKIYKMRLPSTNVDPAPISPPIIQQASFLQIQQSSDCESATVHLLDRPTINVFQSEDQPKSLNILIVDDNPINLKVSGYAAHPYYILIAACN